MNKDFFLLIKNTKYCDKRLTFYKSTQPLGEPLNTILWFKDPFGEAKIFKSNFLERQRIPQTYICNNFF